MPVIEGSLAVRLVLMGAGPPTSGASGTGVGMLYGGGGIVQPPTVGRNVTLYINTTNYSVWENTGSTDVPSWTLRGA